MLRSALLCRPNVDEVFILTEAGKQALVRIPLDLFYVLLMTFPLYERLIRLINAP